MRGRHPRRKSPRGVQNQISNFGAVLNIFCETDSSGGGKLAAGTWGEAGEERAKGRLQNT